MGLPRGLPAVKQRLRASRAFRRSWRGASDANGSDGGSQASRASRVRRVAPAFSRTRSSGSLTHRLGQARVLQTTFDKLTQLDRIPDDRRRLLRQHQLDDIAKVRGLGPKANGRPVTCRFDHILAATWPHTASDKGDLCHTPPRSQLADGIDQEHAPVACRRRVAGRLVQLTAADPGQPDCASSSATKSNRSGCRGTRIRRRFG